MKKVLVLGATGGIGQPLVEEFVGRGISVIAFARSKDTLQNLYGGNPRVETWTGDALHAADVMEASRGVDTIFHCVSIPYPEWTEKLERVARNILEAAKANGCKVVIIDNIYAYGRRQASRIAEQHPKNPHTCKGKLRLKVEQMILDSNKQGIPSLHVHLPDFYGPTGANTMLNVTLQAIASNRFGGFVGDQSIAREYIYLPDAARAIAEIASRDTSYGQNWNVPGAGVITGKEILRIGNEITKKTARIMTITKGMIGLLKLFSPFMKELHEMMYLTEEPLILSGEKYEREIGPIPQTPYLQGIGETIRSLQTSMQNVK
ncbi:NAD-dependent epimerase/dehydratase family protein [Brevibacillus sp. SYSU BS000544]|uniref:NAD-dependent epimerase/dehydratase family protein n=1 Tax=Brevibacillus sp. SYSU BS000544 TaxID=3416443 RepID=UPI003CE592DD